MSVRVELLYCLVGVVIGALCSWFLLAYVIDSGVVDRVFVGALVVLVVVLVIRIQID